MGWMVEEEETVGSGPVAADIVFWSRSGGQSRGMALGVKYTGTCISTFFSTRIFLRSGRDFGISLGGKLARKACICHFW